MLFLSLHRALALALLASLFCLTANAGPSSDPATDALSQIPACGLQCIAQNAPAIGCGLIDIECQCASKNSTQILQPCLKELCTYDETFTILRAQASLCNRPHDSLSNYIRVTAYVTGIIPIIAVTMRFASRHLGGNAFWWDDWLHLTSVVLVIPMTVCLLLNVEAGIGRHLWDLTYPRVMAIGKLTYIATIFWAFELLILKYSILCLYLRIFPNIWLKRAIFAFMIFTTLFTVPLIGLATFQCIPVHAIWDLEAQKTAKCVNWIAVLRLTVVYEVIAEVVLFSLPLPIVMKLQMKLAKKIQVIFFFGLGIIVIGVSIARVPFLPGVIDMSDQSYTVTGTSITGFAASGVGHICATVPTVQALIRFCQNGFKPVSQSSSSYSKNSSYNSTTKRSYRTLEGKKSNSSYPDDTSGAAQQRSKSGSSDPMDPFGVSSIADTEENVGIIELRPVQPSHKEQAKEQPLTVIREISGPRLEDSASDKAILHEDPHEDGYAREKSW